jgi:mRNA interferase HigB
MKKHADARKPLQAWVADVEAATWQRPQDVRDRYASVDFIRDGLVVFDIKGNDYRLAAQIGFNRGTVSVLKVGTHAEYNTWKL